jgi:hypothetical protein
MQQKKKNQFFNFISLYVYFKILKNKKKLPPLKARQVYNGILWGGGRRGEKSK